MIEHIEIHYCDFCGNLIEKDEMFLMRELYLVGVDIVCELVIQAITKHPNHFGDVRDFYRVFKEEGETLQKYKQVCMDCNREITSLVSSLKGKNKKGENKHE